MVFTALAEELRTGDVAVVGSEECADWSEQLPAWEAKARASLSLRSPTCWAST